MRGQLTDTKASFTPKPLITGPATLAIVVGAGVGVGGVPERVAGSCSGFVLGGVLEYPTIDLVADRGVRGATERGGSEPCAVSAALAIEVGEGAGDGPEAQREKQENLHCGEGS